MTDLAGKNILITGAASGIGLATSQLAASQGASLVLVDQSELVSDVAAAINASGGRAQAVTASVTDEPLVDSVIQSCISTYGSLDGLFANAGVPGARKPFAELDLEAFRQTMETNVLGTFLCIQRSAKHMMEQGHGSIVCTASVAGMRANAGGVDYSASKAAIISMVQTVSYQLYGSGVRINAICPGLIESGMTSGLFAAARKKGKEGQIGQINPAARYGKPEEVAEMACFLLGDSASYVNGQALPVDGGLSASHPWIFPRPDG